MTLRLSALLALPLVIFACGSEPALGDPCTVDEDCGDFVCHVHEGDDEGFCDVDHHHDDTDHDHDHDDDHDHDHDHD